MVPPGVALFGTLGALSSRAHRRAMAAKERAASVAAERLAVSVFLYYVFAIRLTPCFVYRVFERFERSRKRTRSAIDTTPR